MALDGRPGMPSGRGAAAAHQVFLGEVRFGFQPALALFDGLGGLNVC